MKNKEPLYFAIDSDILRAITFVDKLASCEEFYDYKNSKDVVLSHWFGYIQNLYQGMKNDIFRLVIVDAVYQESKHSPSLLNFMTTYCYFPKINAINYQEKSKEARELAYAYCEPHIYQGKEFPAPMKMQFNASLSQHTPSNDCYIMAQASIEGICLITANGQDFVFDKKAKTDNNYRLKGIVSINIEKGYGSTNDKDLKQVPRPIHIKTIGPMLKNTENSNLENLPNMKPFDKGSDLLL